MKRITIFAYILFGLLYPIMAQNAFYLEEYDDLCPDINLFARNEIVNPTRKILFYRPFLGRSPILVCNIPSNVLNSFPIEQMEMGNVNMIRENFWDPHTKINYMYCTDTSDEKIKGWYLLAFSNNTLKFHLQDKYQYWANNSPKSVQLSSNRVFTVQYEILHYNSRVDSKAFFTSYKTLFRIFDTNLNKIVWELDTETDNFINLYWITEQWYFRQNRYYFALGESERQNIIYNYETNKTVSFEPECIIGYGRGVILTSRETEDGFIGVTVWTPEKKMLYRDINFSLSGIIDREHGHITFGKPAIYVSYFDYPYIYCNIGRGAGLFPPYGTIIMNLLNGKTYFTPYGYHFFGIFEID